MGKTSIFAIVAATCLATAACHANDPWHWVEEFQLAPGSYVWSAAKHDGCYAAPSMKLLIHTGETEPKHAWEYADHHNTWDEVKSHGTLVSDFKGEEVAAFKLSFDTLSWISNFKFSVSRSCKVRIFTEHRPTDFAGPLNRHYLRMADGTAVLPAHSHSEQDDLEGSVGWDIVMSKILGILSIFLSALGGVFLRLKCPALKNSPRLFGYINVLAGSMFIGMALFHILPESIHHAPPSMQTLLTSDPSPMGVMFFVFLGFALVLVFERVFFDAHGSCHNCNREVVLIARAAPAAPGTPSTPAAPATPSTSAALDAEGNQAASLEREAAWAEDAPPAPHPTKRESRKRDTGDKLRLLTPTGAGTGDRTLRLLTPTGAGTGDKLRLLTPTGGSTRTGIEGSEATTLARDAAVGQDPAWPAWSSPFADDPFMIRPCHPGCSPFEVVQEAVRTKMAEQQRISGNTDNSRSVAPSAGQSSHTAVALLLFALSVHSVFEGVIIGTADSVGTVCLLVGIVVAHEWAAAFAITNHLVTRQIHGWIMWVYLSMFCLASPIGAMLGWLIEEMADEGRSPAAKLTESILNSLAVGTLLYVGMVEVVPEEFNGAHNHVSKFITFMGAALFVFAFTLLHLKYAHSHVADNGDEYFMHYHSTAHAHYQTVMI